MIDFIPILTAVGTGVAYSLFWYLNKVADPTVESPDIDPYPIIATACVGAFLGGISVLTGGELTQVSIEVQIGAYGFFIAVIERTLKTAVHLLESRYGVIS